MHKRKLIDERFWTKVDKNGPRMRPELTPCWLWTGAKTRAKKGRHGMLYSEHIQKPNTKSGYSDITLPAHRVSWEIHYGPIPEETQVLHKCDNGLCVNPEHLELGNQKKNMQDCIARGRGNKSRAPRKRVKRTDAIWMQQNKPHYTCEQLASMFSISLTTVDNIVNKRGSYVRLEERAKEAITPPSPTAV